MFQKYRSQLAGFSLLLLGVCTGCGQSNIELSQNGVVLPDSPENRTTSIAASPVVEQSPAMLVKKDSAKSTPAQDDFDQSPEGLCRQFMERLQEGNSLGAENLLTRMSQMNTTKEELELRPIGETTAKFSIGQVRYATGNQKVAQVDCVVTDDIADEPLHVEMTWLVKRLKKSWRIAGVMMHEQGSTPDLLSFENIADVRRIKQMNDDQAAASLDSPVETRQADASDNSDKLK